MSKVKLTVRELKDLGLWERVCDYKGWSRNNSQSDDIIIEFDSKFDADITEKEVKKLKEIRTYFNHLYASYFNLPAEVRYKIENTENLSLKACVEGGLVTIDNIFRKIDN
ncbi:hypothetical protein ACR77J_07595 [Tissierella praeacuta]|uniref:hypothetical protein n=1 Tax=Tissierella praeacuta TaxID=43131 RepID=UPI003DA37913